VCFEKLPGLRDGGVSSFEGCFATRREKEGRRGRRKRRKEKRSHRATLHARPFPARGTRADVPGLRSALHGKKLIPEDAYPRTRRHPQALNI